MNDELWEVSSDGSAVRFVDFGTYSYRAMAPNYITQTGTVTVNDPENTQTVSVTLSPDFVEVTLKVDADAEIWVSRPQPLSLPPPPQWARYPPVQEVPQPR